MNHQFELHQFVQYFEDIELDTSLGVVKLRVIDGQRIFVHAYVNGAYLTVNGVKYAASLHLCRNKDGKFTVEHVYRNLVTVTHFILSHSSSTHMHLMLQLL